MKMAVLIIALSALAFSIAGIAKERVALIGAGQLLGLIALGLILTQFGMHG